MTSLTFTDYTNSSNNRTETIDYDKIGNPLSYRGATMSWFGRQLRNYSKNGISANFMYDADGLRSAKGVNGVKTTYQYVGDQLFYEKIGENKTLYYFYDSYGNLSQIYYTFGTGEDASTARYFVTTNAQGDVLGLYNSDGVKVGAYDYDAWGNTRMFVVTQDANGKNVYTQINPETQYLNHIVNVNPIRYRGYYYDSDLDLYYLQSRYYDSEIGRFINSDNVTDSGSGVLGYNTYLYCGNNPVNSSDPSGHGRIWNWIKEKLGIGSNLSLSYQKPVNNASSNGGVKHSRGTVTTAEISSFCDKTINVYDSSTISNSGISNGICVSSASWAVEGHTFTDDGWGFSISDKTDFLSGAFELNMSYDYTNITIVNYTDVDYELFNETIGFSATTGEYHNIQIDNEPIRTAGAVATVTAVVVVAVPKVATMLASLIAALASSGGLATAH